MPDDSETARPNGAEPQDPADVTSPTRRTLPRAARLSRLAPSGDPTPGDADTAPVAPAPVALLPVAELVVTSLVATPTLPTAPALPPLPTPAPVATPAPNESSIEVLAATAAAYTDLPPAKPFQAAQMVELKAPTSSVPSPAVAAAQHAAAQEAARAPSKPVTFKPLTDSMATRSVVLSVLGLILCLFPVISLVGLVWGLMAARRIKRSNGTIIGAGSARLGIILGAAGLLIGTIFDVVFLLKR